MSLLSYIIWNADPRIIPGLETPRWYGLLFAMGFLLSQQILIYIYKKEGKPVKDIDTLTVYVVIATIIGARLGHVLFYEPEKYLPNPINILKIWEGGLASHGAAIGILSALWIYCRYDISFQGGKFRSKKIKREGQNYLQVVDRIVIVVAMAGALIRFGNFMNSEIYGYPTKNGAGVIYMRHITETLTKGNTAIEDVSFEKNDNADITEEGYAPIKVILQFKDNQNYTEEWVGKYIENNVKNILASQSPYIAEHIYQPADKALDYQLTKTKGRLKAEVNTFGITRHPTQLYEASSYLLLFIFLLYLWNKRKEKTVPGRIFGTFMALLFGMRFFHEFLKENQVDFENEIPLNMGQWLSIPLVILGLFILIRSFQQHPEKN